MSESELQNKEFDWVWSVLYGSLRLSTPSDIERASKWLWLKTINGYGKSMTCMGLAAKLKELTDGNKP